VESGTSTRLGREKTSRISEKIGKGRGFSSRERRGSKEIGGKTNRMEKYLWVKKSHREKTTLRGDHI